MMKCWQITAHTTHLNFTPRNNTEMKSPAKHCLILALALGVVSCEEIITPDPIVSDNNIWHTPEAGTRYVFAGEKWDTLTYNGQDFVDHDEVSTSLIVVDPDTSALGHEDLMLVSSNAGTNYIGLDPSGDFIRNNNVPGDEAWYALPIATKSTLEGPNLDTVYGGNTYYTYTRSAEYIGEDTVMIHGKTFNAVKLKEISTTDQASPGFSSVMTLEVLYWYLPELKYFGRVETLRRTEQSGYVLTERYSERLVLFTK